MAFAVSFRVVHNFCGVKNTSSVSTLTASRVSKSKLESGAFLVGAEYAKNADDLRRS